MGSSKSGDGRHKLELAEDRNAPDSGMVLQSPRSSGTYIRQYRCFTAINGVFGHPSHHHSS